MIHLRQTLHHKRHPTAFITFAPVRHRCHIRGIRLQNNPFKRHMHQRFCQFAVFESQNASYAQVIAQLQHLLCHLGGTTETMHYPPHHGKLLQNAQTIGSGITAMNHHGQLQVFCPLHLCTQNYLLFNTTGSVKMIIQPDFSNRNKGYGCLATQDNGIVNMLQLRLPILPNILRMQPQGRVEIVRETIAEIQHGRYGGLINSRHQDTLHTTLFLFFQKSGQVIRILRVVNMTMRIYHLSNSDQSIL